MKIKGYLYTVQANVLFTKEEIYKLLNASATHYDFKCRNMCQPGFLLHGMKNFPDTQWALTMDEAQTLAKIAENEIPGISMASIRGQLSLLIHHMNEEWRRLNK